jgi:hypothetical protein
MGNPQSSLCTTCRSQARNETTIRQRGKPLQSKINAYASLAFSRRRSRKGDSKANLPALRVAADRARPNATVRRDRTMNMDSQTSGHSFEA